MKRLTFRDEDQKIIKNLPLPQYMQTSIDLFKANLSGKFPETHDLVLLLLIQNAVVAYITRTIEDMIREDLDILEMPGFDLVSFMAQTTLPLAQEAIDEINAENNPDTKGVAALLNMGGNKKPMGIGLAQVINRDPLLKAMVKTIGFRDEGRASDGTKVVKADLGSPSGLLANLFNDVKNETSVQDRLELIKEKLKSLREKARAMQTETGTDFSDS